MSLMATRHHRPCRPKKEMPARGPAFRGEARRRSAVRLHRDIRSTGGSDHHVPRSGNVARQRHRTRGDHRREKHTSSPHIASLQRRERLLESPESAGVGPSSGISLERSTLVRGAIVFRSWPFLPIFLRSRSADLMTRSRLTEERRTSAVAVPRDTRSTETALRSIASERSRSSRRRSPSRVTPPAAPLTSPELKRFTGSVVVVVVPSTAVVTIVRVPSAFNIVEVVDPSELVSPVGLPRLGVVAAGPHPLVAPLR